MVKGMSIFQVCKILILKHALAWPVNDITYCQWLPFQVYCVILLLKLCHRMCLCTHVIKKLKYSKKMLKGRIPIHIWNLSCITFQFSCIKYAWICIKSKEQFFPTMSHIIFCLKWSLLHKMMQISSLKSYLRANQTFPLIENLSGSCLCVCTITQQLCVDNFIKIKIKWT